MSLPIADHARSIFPEMMSHPALFTHRHPHHVAIIADHEPGILGEVLKHHSVQQVHCPLGTQVTVDKRIVTYPVNDWSSGLAEGALDLIIHAEILTKEWLQMAWRYLHHDGILMQQSSSPFETAALKSMVNLFTEVGFGDLHLLSFPQPGYPTGWRSIFMVLKKGTFRRIREKAVFNKPFKTNYYNFDIHRAAMALPQFLRDDRVMLEGAV